ncbi:hypothetical protein K505DRAFT_330857 [Melanomma pulvis-pyrius CBS 109.77]|uniref:Uncharacterized protein n=1 Tax=Melanomma pulvis-pyrius CBS 109.77 TaxID=1314802 RepID=A0A6A6WNM1_9PLEO|nr:hypothetical protein K505DRAFT_330857 [Melanomma pulvis-pyrius CBS 109.77]
MTSNSEKKNQCGIVARSTAVQHIRHPPFLSNPLTPIFLLNPLILAKKPTASSLLLSFSLINISLSSTAYASALFCSSWNGRLDVTTKLIYARDLSGGVKGGIKPTAPSS